MLPEEGVTETDLRTTFHVELVNSVAAHSSITSGENLVTGAANVTLGHHRLCQTINNMTIQSMHEECGI